MSYYKPKNDVAWYIKGRKKPIAYSSTATRDLIRLIAEESSTVKDAENIVSLAEDLLTVAKDLKKQIKQVLSKA